jgi:acyl-CoA thioesterase I
MFFRGHLKKIKSTGCLCLLFLVLLFPVVSVSAVKPTILVLGDSISAGYGIDINQGWVALLQKRLDEKSYNYRVVNASVSGDTTRTGLNRLPAALAQHSPEIVIVELGGNDGLRGLAFSEIENSLTQIIQLCHKHHAAVLLVGVRLPPNYGTVYIQQFEKLYAKISKKYHVALVPKILDKVADYRQLLQQDGIHPTVQGQPQVMHNVWAGLKPLLRREK